MALLIRIVYRYNAPIMLAEYKRKKPRRVFTAKKRLQQQVNNDYYIVDYVWSEGRRQKDYACRCLGVPPDVIQLGYVSFGRLVVVDGPVNRMDNDSDPYISGDKSKFPWQAYSLVILPIIITIATYVMTYMFL